MDLAKVASGAEGALSDAEKIALGAAQAGGQRRFHDAKHPRSRGASADAGADAGAGGKIGIAAASASAGAGASASSKVSSEKALEAGIKAALPQAAQGTEVGVSTAVLAVQTALGKIDASVLQPSDIERVVAATLGSTRSLASSVVAQVQPTTVHAALASVPQQLDHAVGSVAQ